MKAASPELDPLEVEVKVDWTDRLPTPIVSPGYGAVTNHIFQPLKSQELIQKWI